MPSLPPRNPLLDHSLELLSSIGQSSAQRMFGGYGLRVDGVFVALLAFGRLYLKADAQTRSQFAAAGCEPFVYEARGRPVALSYWTVPPLAMDSPEQMRPWARLALQAAMRAQAGAPRRRAQSAGTQPRRPATAHPSAKIPRAPPSKR
jgi:DNA transformation protein